MAYRNYIADSIYYNTQQPRQFLKDRFRDLINPDKDAQVESESQEKILERLKAEGITIIDDEQPEEEKE